MNPVSNFTVKNDYEADTSIKVGDRVRSYDTEFRDDCYIEGVVCDVDYNLGGCRRYVIEADKRVIEGEDQTDSLHTRNDRFYPPMNGVRVIFGGYCNGVRKVDR